jgi:hypothetical protein
MLLQPAIYLAKVFFITEYAYFIGTVSRENEFVEIFHVHHQCRLPPVLAANFATSSACVVDTGGK